MNDRTSHRDGEADILAVLVSRKQWPSLKPVLEGEHVLHDRHKVKPFDAGREGGQLLACPLRFSPEATGEEAMAALRSVTGLVSDERSFRTLPESFFTTKARHAVQTPEAVVRRAFRDWLSRLQHDGSIGMVISALEKGLPRNYTLYDSLALLPSTAFASPPWRTLLSEHPDLGDDFFATLARHLKVTHVAINAPIPLLSRPDPSCPSSDRGLEVGTPGRDCTAAAIFSRKPNIVRSPTSFQPLHGDFGPTTPSSSTGIPPNRDDLAAAFWTSTRQNGIHQVWAPRHTMFSAGNVREKTRLLTLPSVTSTVTTTTTTTSSSSSSSSSSWSSPSVVAPQGEKAEDGGRGRCAVVDLYVGIGYFAFSYLAAGVDVVLGWDLNPWSIEGARRGAERNGWGCSVVRFGADGEQEGEEEGEEEEEKRRSEVQVVERGLVLFCENNEAAVTRLSTLKGVPPVRHVNCGLLPSSRGSWDTAVQVLDRDLGGWLHVHENFGVAEIESKVEWVREEIEARVRVVQGWPKGTSVRVDQVFRVKTYAPGVMHSVVDVHIDPRGSFVTGGARKSGLLME